MSSRVADLVEKIRSLESENELELSRRRDDLKCRVEQGRARFEDDMPLRHRQVKVVLVRYIASASLLVILRAPLIYALIIPFVMLDLFVSVYQAVCFPIYKISKVKRSDFFMFDRDHMAYLNALENYNCAYCAYGNGFLSYVREIPLRTGAVLVPIKHS